MQSIRRFPRQKHQGSALIISMIFVIVLTALAVSVAAISGTSIQIANNQSTANRARAASESGLEVTRFWLSQVIIPGTVAEEQRLEQISSALQNALLLNGVTNITANYDGTSITIPSTTLDSTSQQSFSAGFAQIDVETIQIDVTGVCGPAIHTIRANYKFTTRAHTVFDYGVATKGPLSLSGNVEIETVNVAVGAGVYIESQNSNLALSITGNSQIAEDVSIVNPIANVYLQGAKAGIGGQTGQDAINNHVSFGSTSTEFPAPNPGHFESYAINIVNSTTNTSDAVLDNIRIVAGTNPIFSGQVTLRGVIFIEAPNIVSFQGNTTITGLIIGNGDIDDDSGINQINFSGNVVSNPVTQLPDEEEFAAIKTQTGTFLMAPGFGASFSGNFHTLNGAIAANGIQFCGNAGGTVNGSVINYSDTQMEMTGNSDLLIYPQGTTNMPAGFTPEITLRYDPSSYSEVIF